tara:strand:- start:943 stop:1113 length:171 start_codon:yes stop_codon:yes gene_type:complete
MILEVLQFYVSGFWVWLGITYGLYAIAHGIVLIVGLGYNFRIAAIRAALKGDANEG